MATSSDADADADADAHLDADACADAGADAGADSAAGSTVGTDRADGAETAETRWLEPAEQAAWRAYLEMSGRLSAQLNRELQESCGVSGAEFAVLVQLSENADGRMRVLELARDLRWEKSRLSHQLGRMQQRGLIERSDCNEDRRGAFVILTARGRATVETAAPRHVESVRRYLFDELSAGQVADFGDVCRSVLGRLDALAGPAAQ
jgi:DNA-binding MarR family transcriptional regulator